ncbi:hypothetical protein [Bacillus cereus group sp. BY105LC]|uniref:Uncharacterized protein n=1 Tax=Bacillus thuringiensis subsp. konkukian (strain 97-27) TaxID=281309 RepID=Q6HIA8_BACHK|nr:hypothetical protein [Bacillus cereus group sp. BY105LC]AAT59993.1 hypothetical protein BT9727_2392 [[Bacillus thuringiensis] serovar konkukian str. 97-27]
MQAQFQYRDEDYNTLFNEVKAIMEKNPELKNDLYVCQCTCCRRTTAKKRAHRIRILVLCIILVPRLLLADYSILVLEQRKARKLIYKEKNAGNKAHYNLKFIEKEQLTTASCSAGSLR